MILGVDFDNTLVCYDGLFHRAAVERGLMPQDGPRDKRGVRDYLVGRGREDDFTLLQGYVYGPGLALAGPYPEAPECLRRLKAAGAELYVVSHKTGTPFAGPAWDLRQAARDWLAANGFYAPGVLDPDRVFWEDTMEDKATRVAALGCTHFIDDMRRFFLHPLFPAGVKKYLFLPGGKGKVEGTTVLASWREAIGLLLPECNS